ncbi:MAG: aminodeoxychorismate synthase component I [Clostridium sp.]
MKLKIKNIETSLNPHEVYEAVRGKNTIFLDSSKEDEKLAKFSFIGINPFKIKESKNFNGLEKELQKYKYEFEGINESPFLAGAIGYISYDTFTELEDIKDNSEEDFKIPNLRFVFFNNIIIYNHKTKEYYISDIEGSDSRINDIISKINNFSVIGKTFEYDRETKFNSNFTRNEYIDAVTKMKDYIKSGDVYIANMTQRFWCDNNDDSFEIYLKLRDINKAPFSAYLDFEDFQVISSSPERFIQIVDGKAHTRPIKGTRPRGNTLEEDERNKIELLNSEKDKAELLMVVDLERNDLSKVCKPFSVKVTELFELEEYATVFHLVSTVEGELQDTETSVNCIKECFPGGSITGTPKIRAMEVIEELEGLKRNLYTGCIGYFDFNGNSDFNIVIRTIVKKDGKAYFGVGGGITYDSIEEDEYEETLDKAKALMRVL